MRNTAHETSIMTGEVNERADYIGSHLPECSQLDQTDDGEGASTTERLERGYRRNAEIRD